MPDLRNPPLNMVSNERRNRPAARARRAGLTLQKCYLNLPQPGANMGGTRWPAVAKRSRLELTRDSSRWLQIAPDPAIPNNILPWTRLRLTSAVAWLWRDKSPYTPFPRDKSARPESGGKGGRPAGGERPVSAGPKILRE